MLHHATLCGSPKPSSCDDHHSADDSNNSVPIFIIPSFQPVPLTTMIARSTCSALETCMQSIHLCTYLCSHPSSALSPNVETMCKQTHMAHTLAEQNHRHPACWSVASWRDEPSQDHKHKYSDLILSSSSRCTHWGRTNTRKSRQERCPCAMCTQTWMLTHTG